MIKRTQSSKTSSRIKRGEPEEPVVKRKTDFSDIEGRIVNVVDIKKPMRVALYGRSGSGKTTLACTFPAPLLIDMKDDGTDSVTDVKDLKVLRAEEWEDLESIYWYLEAGKHKFKTVVLDTVTMMQDFAVREVLTRKKKKVTEDAGNWGTLTKQEWGDAASILKTWIMHFRELPMNVVFIAQERIFNAGDEADDEGQIAPEVGPRLMPSVASTLNAAVDLIGNVFIRETVQRKKVKGETTEKRVVQHCLRIGPHSYYITKVRKPRSVEIPRFLIDASYEDLVELKTGDV